MNIVFKLCLVMYKQILSVFDGYLGIYREFQLILQTTIALVIINVSQNVSCKTFEQEVYTTTSCSDKKHCLDRESLSLLDRFQYQPDEVIDQSSKSYGLFRLYRPLPRIFTIS